MFNFIKSLLNKKETVSKKEDFNISKLLGILDEPKDGIEEIAYQTILPYYHPEIINQYRSINNEHADVILFCLEMEIRYLTEEFQTFFFKSGTLKIDLFKKYLRENGYSGNLTGKYIGG